MGQVPVGHCWKFGFCSKCGGTPGTSEPVGGRGRGSDKRQVAQVITLWAQQRTKGRGGGTAEQGLSQHALPPFMRSWILVGLEVTFQLLGWCP